MHSSLNMYVACRAAAGFAVRPAVVIVAQSMEALPLIFVARLLDSLMARTRGYAGASIRNVPFPATLKIRAARDNVLVSVAVARWDLMYQILQ